MAASLSSPSPCASAPAAQHRVAEDGEPAPATPKRSVWTRIVRETPHHLNANDQIRSGDFEPNVGSKNQGATAVSRNPLICLVAGAGYAECHTAPRTYWIDLVRQ
jgi:hypothetical protein